MFNTLKNKGINFTRLLFVNSLTILNKSVLLIEYPKSGGTWLGQLVSEYLQIPFPSHKMPSLNKSLYLGHYLPRGWIKKNKKIIFLVRDGRDVLISLYFHQLFFNEKNINQKKDVLYYRKKF